MPEGHNHLLVILGGTFARRETWYKFKPGRENFAAALLRSLEQDGRSPLRQRNFVWGGENDHFARLRAASSLALFLNDEHRPARAGEPLFVHLVAHSHGGSVALASLDYLWNVNVINRDGPVRIEFDRATGRYRTVRTGQATQKGPIRVASLTLLGTPFFKARPRLPWSRPRYVYDVSPFLRGRLTHPDAPVTSATRVLNVYHGCGDEVVLGLYCAVHLPRLLENLTREAADARDEPLEDAITLASEMTALDRSSLPLRKTPRLGRSPLLDAAAPLRAAVERVLWACIRAVGRRYALARAFGLPATTVLASTVEVEREFHVPGLDVVVNRPLETDDTGELKLAWHSGALEGAREALDPELLLRDVEVRLLHGSIHDGPVVLAEVAANIRAAVAAS